MKVINVIKSLDDDTRLKMVYILSKYKFCQDHLSKLLDLNQANVSRSLNKLVESNILDFEMTNRKNRYFVKQEFIDSYPDLYQHIISHFDNSYLNVKLENLEEECEIANEV